MTAPVRLPPKELALFCKKHHIFSLALFGSVLNDNFGPQSDIDFLVEFETKHIPTLFDVADMEFELNNIVGRNVDLRTAEDLSPYFRDQVIRQAKKIYEAERP